MSHCLCRRYSPRATSLPGKSCLFLKLCIVQLTVCLSPCLARNPIAFGNCSQNVGIPTPWPHARSIGRLSCLGAGRGKALQKCCTLKRYLPQSNFVVRSGRRFRPRGTCVQSTRSGGLRHITFNAGQDDGWCGERREPPHQKEAIPKAKNSIQDLNMRLNRGQTCLVVVPCGRTECAGLHTYYGIFGLLHHTALHCWGQGCGGCHMTNLVPLLLVMKFSSISCTYYASFSSDTSDVEKENI